MVSFTDKPSEKDELGIQNYIDGLADFITECETPLTIAIQGDWGTGKTSIMLQLKKKILKSSNTKTIMFNTWQYSQFNMENDLSISLITELIEYLSPDDEIRKNVLNNTIKFFTTGAKYLTTELPSFNNEKITEDIHNFLAKKFLNRNKGISKLKQDFQKAINDYIKKNNCERIVIFIDDLDRLVPQRAVELLEVLKLFLDCDNCIFVLAIDYAVVVRGVKNKYGDDFEDYKGRAFFDKIIQVPFTVPVANYDIQNLVDSYMKKLQFKNNEDKLLATKLITTSIGNNPRSINRLFNSLNLLTKIMGDKHKNNNKENYELLLLASVCLQLAYENIYTWLLSSYNYINLENENNFDDDINLLIECLESNFKLQSDNELLTKIYLDNISYDTLNNDRFKEFYTNLKAILKNNSNANSKSKKSVDENNINDNLSNDELINFMDTLTLSNTVATGNIDIKANKQNHTANEDIQYIIRKIYNELTESKKIDIENNETFGKEPKEIREDFLCNEFKNEYFNKIRITSGKGQGINIFNERNNNKNLIYFSGDTYGTLINDGIFLMKNGKQINKIQRSEYKNFDNKEIRNNEIKYSEFKNKLLEHIKSLMKYYKDEIENKNIK